MSSCNLEQVMKGSMRSKQDSWARMSKEQTLLEEVRRRSWTQRLNRTALSMLKILPDEDHVSMLEEIPHESLHQLLNDVRPQPELALIPGFPLLPGNAVEIQGASGSGKTHLIYAALITCILPANLAGGWSKAAVLFDSDNSFDQNRFKSLLVSRLASLLHSDPTSEATQSLADRCLASLHIFRPTSSNQLASTILHLPSYQSAHLTLHEIGLIAIDSLSAFYWPDRFTVEQLRRSRTGDNTEKDAPNPLRHILIALERLRVLCRPLIVFTNWGLTFAQPNAPSDVRFYKQHLHPSLSPFPNDSDPIISAHNEGGSLSLTHHITLHSIPALQSRQGADLGPDTTGDEETLGSAMAKQKQLIVGTVRIPGVPEVGRFSFTIKAEALFFGAGAQQ